MKKTTFLMLVASIFSACMSAPQVTVTSEVAVTLTPIPAPTLHPQFISLQEKIAASGDRFSLNAEDGLIYDGSTPIPGLTVAPDGAISLTVDGETVQIDPADVSFDDENGISIDGYELDEDGAWVEAISEAMQQTTALLDQYAIDPESVTVTEEGGAVNVTDNETGTVLIRTIGENSKFDLGFAVDTIAKNSCEPTKFIPTRRGGLSAENGNAPMVYFTEIGLELQESGFNIETGRAWHVLIDRERQCWGVIMNHGTALIYRDVEGIAQQIPLIGLSKEEIEAFISNR